MVTTASIAEVAAMIGEPARAAMLQALVDGRALTASELAQAASVTPQTASGHLAKLAASGLVVAAAQGRHRYHRLASPQVARLLESLMLVAAGATRPPRTGPRDPHLRLARTCYDHIAGRLGVALADAMNREGWIEIDDETCRVTEPGLAHLTRAGIELAPGRSTTLCRLCLDWSERRPHLAGRLGAALCAHGLTRRWIVRRQGSRALDITAEGHRVFGQVFRAERLTLNDMA